MTSPELEAMLAANRDDKHAWQVYADWLLEQGEPWGAVMVAAAAGKPIRPMVPDAEKSWIGGLDGVLIGWKTEHAVVDWLKLTPEENPEDEAGEKQMAEVLRRVLGHPAGRLLRSLTLGLPPRFPGNIDWHFGDLIAAIADVGPLPLLAVLDLTPDAQHMDQDSWQRVGDLRRLWAAAPRLVELRLKGSSGSDGGAPIQLGDMVAPHLERLVYISSGLDEKAPLEIGKATLPNLRHLELYLGRQDYGNTCTLASFAAIFDGAGLPKLETLALKNSEWEAELVHAVAAAPLVRRCKHLDLSLGVLCHDGAAALVAEAPRLAHLESINLDDNYLGAEEIDALEKALPRCNFGEQRELEDGYSRYCSVGE